MIPKTYKTQGWKNILKIIIPYFIVLGIFHFIGSLIVGIDPKSYKEATTQQYFILLLFNMVGTATVIGFFKKIWEEIRIHLLQQNTIFQISGMAVRSVLKPLYFLYCFKV